jgi:hypothetical protein
VDDAVAIPSFTLECPVTRVSTDRTITAGGAQVVGITWDLDVANIHKGVDLAAFGFNKTYEQEQSPSAGSKSGEEKPDHAHMLTKKCTRASEFMKRGSYAEAYEDFNEILSAGGSEEEKNTDEYATIRFCASFCAIHVARNLSSITDAMRTIEQLKLSHPFLATLCFVAVCHAKMRLNMTKEFGGLLEDAGAILDKWTDDQKAVPYPGQTAVIIESTRPGFEAFFVVLEKLTRNPPQFVAMCVYDHCPASKRELFLK